MYQNISRKYRPQTFKNIIGQEPIVTTLKNAIKFGKIAPAYLFCGCRGTGKTTLARLFAKTLNCQSLQQNIEPCNECPSCIAITQGKSLDVMEIDGASNRGIDDIRQINETVGYAPSESRFKIYIIDEVHMLTKEAFNALLKTLEEPPASVKFFFATTEPHKVLPTIMSRCQRFDLHRLTLEQIVHKLKQIASDLGATVQNEALQLIAHVAEGGLRDAESLFDQLMCYTNGSLNYEETAQVLGISPRSLYFRLDQAIHAYELSFAFDLASEIFGSGKDLSSFLDGLMEHYRTILLLKIKLPPFSYLSEKDEQEYINSAGHYTEEHCLYIIDYLMHWAKEIHRTPFKRITLEMILLHLIRSKKRISMPHLVRRLEELSQSPQEIVEKKERVAEIQPQKEPVSLPQEKKAALHSVKLTQIETLNSEPESPSPSRKEDKGDQFGKIATIESTQKILPLEQCQSAGVEAIDKEGSINPIQPPLSIAQPQEISHQLQGQDLLSTGSSPNPQNLTASSLPSSAGNERQQKSRYDTLLRFAAVELEGVIKKE